MKHNIHAHPFSILTTLVMVMLTFLTGCYKDKSTFAYDTIAPVELDTVGIPKKLFVEYKSNLKLEPKLANHEGLKFKWEIYKSTKDAKTDKITIGTELALDYKADLPESTNPYNLLLTVTDTKHGDLETIYNWQLTIQGRITSGLLVAEKLDDNTSDLSYIKSPNITTNYKDKPATILKNLLGETKAGKIKGEVNQLLYNYFGYPWRPFPYSRIVWVTTTDGQLLQLNKKDMELKADLTSNDMVVYKPKEDLKAQHIFLTSQSLFLRTDAGYYTMQGLTGYLNDIGYFQVPEESLGKLQISNDQLGEIAWNNPEAMGLYYDNTEGKIKNIKFNGGLYSLYDYKKATAENGKEKQQTEESTFDPEKLTGYTAIAVANTSNNQEGRLLLKSSSGEYELYTVVHPAKEQKNWKTKEITKPKQDPIALKKYTISSEAKKVLEGAKAVFFSPVADLIYVVTHQSIYALTYSSLKKEVKYNSTPLYTIPSGETITKAKIFIQGDYSVNMGNTRPVLPWNLKALVVVSEKSEKEGTVRVIPMDKENLAKGTLLTSDSEIETHTGFGKILYVTHVGD